MSPSCVLFHAHPDDEALLTAGSMAMLAAEGHRVVLVVATLGERGLAAGFDVGDYRLGELRRAALEASAPVHGCARLIFWATGTRAGQRRSRAATRHVPRSRRVRGLRRRAWCSTTGGRAARGRRSSSRSTIPPVGPAIVITCTSTALTPGLPRWRAPPRRTTYDRNRLLRLYVSCGGTLLGALRHGGLIPWDADGDVAIRDADAPRLLAGHHRFLADRGFGIARERRFALVKIFPLDGHRIRPWHRFRFPYVDIFPQMQRPAGWTHVGWLTRHRWPGEYLYPAGFRDLQRYPFGPLQLCGPSIEIAHRYLHACFGSTWKTEARFDTHHVAGLRGVPPQAVAGIEPAAPSAALMAHWNDPISR